jgi:hypothetical protein
MRKLLLSCLVFGTLSLAASVQASAAVPAQAGIAAAATVVDNTIAVKRAKWKKRPPGWNRGRKVGWRGSGMPPGQRKKHRY